MDMDLTFANGNLSGSGSDDVGRFLIKGRYDESTSECYWTKTYIGAHDVFYGGYREGKGIWGRWEIQSTFHGGFHIWPKGAPEGNQDAVHEAESQTVDAVAVGDDVRRLYSMLFCAFRRLIRVSLRCLQQCP